MYSFAIRVNQSNLIKAQRNGQFLSIKICPSVSKLEVDTHLRPNTYPSPIAGTLPPSVLTLLVCNFLTKLDLVFCYKNCSDLLREKIVLVIEKIFCNLICRISEITKQFIQTVKGQNNF